MIKSLLGGPAATPTTNKGIDALTAFLAGFSDIANTIMLIVIAIVAAAAIGFAIYVAFRLAKAEDDGKRKEAKQQLLWSIIGVVGAVLIFVLITTVFNKAMLGRNDNLDKITNPSALEQVGNIVVSAIFSIMGLLFNLLAIGAMLFAVYLAIRLATATDEGKRKQAKQQLLWSVIGIVGAIVLVVVINTVIFDVLLKLPELTA